MNKEIKRKIYAMALAGLLFMIPKKAYAAEITEGDISKKIGDELDTSFCSSEVIEDVKSISSIDYDKKEDAQKWIDDTTDNLEKNYDIVSEKIIEKTVTDVKEEINIEEKFDTKEEAEIKKEEYESEENTKSDLKIEEEITTKEKETVVEVDETFETKEELDEYKDSLSDKEKLEVKEEVITSEEIGEKEKVTEITKDNEEELDTETNKVLAEIDKEKYQTSVEKSFSEETVLKETKEEEISESFDTLEEAESFIDSKKQTDSANVSYEFGEIEKVTETKKETTNFEEETDSEEKIKDIIEQIENEGFEITNYTVIDESETITKEVESGAINVNNFVKYESDSYFEASGNFIIIKQGSSTAVLWTPNQISSEEQTTILDIIVSNNYDPSISNVSFNYISGIGSHDLSYLGKNWGIYNIGYENGVVQLACDKDRISHLNIGSYENEKEVIEEVIPKYKVSGTKTRDVSCDKYNVSGKKIESIYETIPQYTATIFRSPIYKNSSYRIYGQYVVKEKSSDVKYVLQGNILKLIDKKQYQGMIEYKKSEKIVIPNNEKDIPNNNNTYSNDENPKMGDDSNIDLALSTLTLSSLGLISIAGYGLNQAKTKKKILK